uniref:MARVEL domain-containing protein n=1 Tax=Bursaphelenchus xylophilus TaxID=6326 RepID=A0A1I7RIB6_BURXY
MSEEYSAMDVNQVNVGCCGGTVKQVVTRVGIVGCILSLLAVVELFTGGQYSSGNLIYFIFCLLLIYGARSNKPMYFWPFMVYNALLIVANILATVAIIVLYFAAKSHHKKHEDVDNAWVLAVATVILVLITFFNIFFEHVIVTCYKTVRNSGNLMINV